MHAPARCGVMRAVTCCGRLSAVACCVLAGCVLWRAVLARGDMRAWGSGQAAEAEAEVAVACSASRLALGTSDCGWPGVDAPGSASCAASAGGVVWLVDGAQRHAHQAPHRTAGPLQEVRRRLAWLGARPNVHILEVEDKPSSCVHWGIHPTLASRTQVQRGTLTDDKE